MKTKKQKIQEAKRGMEKNKMVYPKPIKLSFPSKDGRIFFEATKATEYYQVKDVKRLLKLL